MHVYNLSSSSLFFIFLFFQIKDIVREKGQKKYLLEYVDFPDEDLETVLLYQKHPTRTKKSQQKKLELMLRPPFPRIYRESQMPDVNTISEVAVIYSDARKIGDLVDWFTDGCYWSGIVTKILEDEKVQIELFPPPVGEGLSYKVCCKDLRPSLDWSPENGWTMSTQRDSKNCELCAWIVKPVARVAEKSPSSLVRSASEERIVVPGIAAASQSSFVSRASSNSSQPLDKLEEIKKQPLAATTEKLIHTPAVALANSSGIGKTGCSDNDSNSHVKSTSNEIGETTVEKDKFDDGGSSKKMRIDGYIPLKLMCSDTIEAAIVDLEDLINQVKWMKGILLTGMPLSNIRPPWEFLEHRASPAPK
ncbi:Agenet domain type [Parasponia andersonii]|uniref:Agenet domain type n=1 Tax=Parasponia andersonii TaxID=3476 RepID=A0A2P5BWU0_PARAD|nr:Agenet domain type [Parasponia andersonii]